MDERIARCLLLAEVLAADGTMTTSERALLDKHFDTEALSAEEREQILKLGSVDEAVYALRHRPSAER